MTAESKKRKEKNNPHSNHGFALKVKQTKLKRRLYFNSSQRQENNKINDN
jgi:hypothetical protein